MLCGIKYRPIVWIIRRRQIDREGNEEEAEDSDGMGGDRRRWDKTKHPVIEG
jgi:hypothetical protein